VKYCYSVNKIHDCEFGAMVIKYREDKDLDRNELGALLNVSGSTIGSWENGVHLPKIPQFLKVCELFKVTPNDLLGF